MEKIRLNNYGEAFLTDFIFDETLTVLLSKIKDKNRLISIGEILKMKIKERISEDLFERSWKIFKEQNKTSFSFTDCSIIAVINKTNTSYLATFDEEFKSIEGISIIQ